jgi:hypothetical protein
MANRYANERGNRFISVGATGSFGATPACTGTGNATGAGDEIGLAADAETFRLPANYSWDIIVAGGTYTALTVSLQRSQDGTNWADIDSDTGGATIQRDVVNKPAKYLRAKVTTATVNTGTPQVTIGITV